MNDKINEAYFDLFTRAVEYCFNPLKPSELKSKAITRRILNTRRKFISEDKIVKIWLDCTSNFEYKKLVQAYKDFEKKYILFI